MLLQVHQRSSHLLSSRSTQTAQFHLNLAPANHRIRPQRLEDGGSASTHISNAIFRIGRRRKPHVSGVSKGPKMTHSRDLRFGPLAKGASRNPPLRGLHVYAGFRAPFPWYRKNAFSTVIIHYNLLNGSHHELHSTIGCSQDLTSVHRRRNTVSLRQLDRQV